MASSVPKIKLSSGKEIPALGLGTWQSKVGEVELAVGNAIECGYRHIDCALVYGNENEIGTALKASFDKKIVTREELFITSKCWNTYHSQGKVVECCKESLKRLGLEYLDLYLIHWPMGYQENGELFPKDGKGNILKSDIDYVETWKGLEDCVKQGLVKSIGLSNFNSEQITRVLAAAEIKPVTNQVECHVYLNQNKLKEFCAKHDITLTAYSPLGSPNNPLFPSGSPSLLEDSEIIAIAKAHGKSPAQVLIKFQLQRGVIVIPKSVTKDRIKANFEVFDFELTPEEMKTLEGLNRDHRYLQMTLSLTHKYYPFNLPF